MYPRLQEGVTFGYVTRGDDSERHYFIADKNKRKFEVSFFVYRELMRADGTHPVRIPGTLLREMKVRKLLTTSRFFFDGVFNRFILFPIGPGAKRFRPICRILNGVLPFLILLLFVISIVMMLISFTYPLRDISFPVYIFLLAFSLLAHELGHLIAGISYGYRFSEMGLILLGIFPFGAYVSFFQKQNVRASARVQLSLAGIEANILLGSLFLLLSMHPSQLDFTFLLVSVMNFFLAALNLIPASGLDGGAALGAMLGFEDIGASSKSFFTDKAFRGKVLQAGTRGYICAFFFCVNLLSNVFAVLLLIFDFISVFRSFF